MNDALLRAVGALTALLLSWSLPLLAAEAAGRTFLFVLTGESNAGGLAPNSEARPQELGVRRSLQILDNAGLASFLALDIGGNNLVGHSGLTSGTTHGCELELANVIAADPWFAKPCFLVKTGQGGSRIAQWNQEGVYFQAFKQRVEAARLLLRGRTYRPVVLFSLGINDGCAGTFAAGPWKALVKQHFANLRSELGSDTPIIMTRFMKTAALAPVNAAIDELDQEDANAYAVETADAPLVNPRHWNYAGMKLVTDRLLTVVKTLGE